MFELFIALAGAVLIYLTFDYLEGAIERNLERLVVFVGKTCLSADIVDHTLSTWVVEYNDCRSMLERFKMAWDFLSSIEDPGPIKVLILEKLTGKKEEDDDTR